MADPGGAVAIPGAVGDSPFAVQDIAPVAGEGDEERSPGLGEIEGDGSGFVVGDDSGLDLFAHGRYLCRVCGRQGFNITGQPTFGVDAFGDVVAVAVTQNGFQQEPLRAIGVRLQQTALEGVGHIVGFQCAAIVEGYAFADIKGVSQAIFGDEAIFQAGDFFGQCRNDRAAVALVEVNQPFHDVL